MVLQSLLCKESRERLGKKLVEMKELQAQLNRKVEKLIALYEP